jgi:hypothetical protein
MQDVVWLKRALGLQRNALEEILDARNSHALSMCLEVMDILNNCLSEKIFSETDDLVVLQRAVLQNLDMGRTDEAIVLQRSAIEECELVLSLL